MIVVGAGMAAVHHLISSCDPLCSVMVLEGADYIGGRIRAIPWPGTTGSEPGLRLNVGAHWVAGDGPHHPLDALFRTARAASLAHGRSKLTPFDPSDVVMLGLSCGPDGTDYDWSRIALAFERVECIDARHRGSVAAALAAVGWTATTAAEWGVAPRTTASKSSVSALCRCRQQN